MTARAEGNIYDSYLSNPAISNCPLEENLAQEKLSFFFPHEEFNRLIHGT
jgi:hypothetical protein